jgi:hypothetical protein
VILFKLDPSQIGKRYVPVAIETADPTSAAMATTTKIQPRTRSAERTASRSNSATLCLIDLDDPGR